MEFNIMKIFFLFGSFLAVFATFMISLIVFVKGHFKKRLNRSFILLNLAIGLWCLSSFVINTFIDDYNYALYFERFCYLFGILIPIFTVYFSYYLRNKHWKKSLFKVFLFLLTIILLIFLPTPLFVKGLVEMPGINVRESSPGILYFLFILQLSLGCCYSIYMFYKGMKESTGIVRNQFKLVFIGYSLAYLGGVFYFFNILYVVKYFAFLHYFVAFGMGAVFYAIVQHKLMDIDLAWRYSLEYIVYFILTGVFIVAVYLLLVNLKVSTLMSIVVLTIPVLTLVPYFKKHIIKHTHKILMKKYLKVWNELKVLAEDDKIRYEIKDIINIITVDTAKILKLEDAQYFEYHEPQMFVVFSSEKRSEYKEISSQDFFVKFLETNRPSYLYKQYLDSIKDKKIVSFMEDLNIELCFPVFNNNLLVGILFYGAKKDQTVFHREEIDILEEIAKKAQEQIINVINVQDLSLTHAENVLNQYKQTYQVKILEETKHLSQIRNLEDFTDHSIKLINRLLNSSQTNIYLYDENDREYINQDAEADVKEISGKNYLVKYLTEKKDMVLTSNLEKWAKETGATNFKEALEAAKRMNASVIIPLIDVSNLLGFLTIGNREGTEQKYTQDDFLLLSFITDKIQSTLTNIYANDKANIDFLTGLHNWNFLMHRLEAEVIKSQAEGTSLSFVLIDIDEFKSFNDVGGHEEGDLVLEEIAEILVDLVRPFDECFRYGGDEFAIILRDTDSAGARSFVDRLKLEFAQHKILEELYEIFHEYISFSIGVSTYRPKKQKEDHTLLEIQTLCEMLVQRAETVLYGKKGGERNYVCISNEFDSVKYDTDEESGLDRQEEMDFDEEE